MNRGFYTSVSAMMVGTKKLNDIANNMVNVTTTGYKKDTSITTQFSDLVINKVNENIVIGNLQNQVCIDDMYTDYSQGSLIATNRETDFAIQGDGFFKIEKNGEYVYSRAGEFNFDGNGYLVTSDGGFVMGKNNQRINKETTEDVASNLMIVDFENKHTLTKTQDNYFSNTFNLSGETIVDNPDIKVGYLESSNVNVASEMADLIKEQRYFQFNQRSFAVHDELFEKISSF